MTTERSIPRYDPAESADAISAAEPLPSCPVTRLALTVRRLWAAHDAVDRVNGAEFKAGSGRAWHRQTQNALAEQIEATADFATFAQAETVDGALFQVALISDAISTMMERLPEKEQGAFAIQSARRKIDRLVGSAVRLLEPNCSTAIREIATTYCGRHTKLMPGEAAAEILAEAKSAA